MPDVKTYHRPQNVEEALILLVQKGQSARILAGGTRLVPVIDDEITDLIDLQSLGMDHMEFSGDHLTVGAMTRLQAIIENEKIPSVVREATKLEGPNTLRNAATVGGTLVCGDWQSEFYAAMLAFDAKVTIKTAGDSCDVRLEEFEASEFPDGIMTKISFATDGKAAHERVARTPADKPIVAVIGRRDATGAIKMAYCGVAEKPCLLTMGELQSIVPPGDFRGSPDYRKAVAAILAQRIIMDLS
jgi:CO/xanthine dehydrogenase FAD-binding subunit